MNNLFCLGNGESRLEINLEDLRPHGKIYGCNALYRDFIPDVLVAVDPAMHNEILATDYIESNKGCFRETVTPPNKRYSKNPDGEMVEDTPVPWEHPNITKIQEVIELFFADNANEELAKERGLFANHPVIPKGNVRMGFSSGPQSIQMACLLDMPTDVYIIGHDFFSKTEHVNNVYKDSLNYAPAGNDPTPGGNWMEHIKILFYDFPKVKFWHVNPLGFIAPWEEAENIQSLSFIEMWKRLNI